ncbi:hypothetical protein [Stenotrophomonas phage BUCT627]|uniref:Uncharacterized protein n=2 Tax=Bixiavirus TaxID=3044676 RepID=A0AC61NLU0_9CAUD|nr:hypothetical protein PQD76_gp63 [Stenotrophomonas phage BUCT626]YP_010677453.1 hypothetical protein PQD77_gp047 [Stenotrophomonas phage BUCT627]QYC96653.1 hypothetical protein [Stenotrophomonas phage BUCT627]QYC96767.1 hypothetical protein [Stenotrophomonas phage BUCT626]
MSRVSKLKDRYQREVIRTFLAMGFYLTVNNGHFDICRRERDYGTICDAMKSASIDRITLHRFNVVKVDPVAVGWVEISHEGDHRDMFADYSPSISFIMDKFDEAIRNEVIIDARKRA